MGYIVHPLKISDFCYAFMKAWTFNRELNMYIYRCETCQHLYFTYTY